MTPVHQRALQLSISGFSVRFSMLHVLGAMYSYVHSLQLSDFSVRLIFLGYMYVKTLVWELKRSSKFLHCRHVTLVIVKFIFIEKNAFTCNSLIFGGICLTA